MAYVYKHIRKDNNQVFYVGIGADNKGKYSRAYSLRRNGFWHIIKNKSDYLVEIVYDNITWEEACNIEKTLIKKYGRKDLGEGTLCNLTDGGEGTINVAQSVKKVLSEKATKQWTGVPKSEASKAKTSATLMGHKNSPSIPCSAEKAAKISQAQKGRPLSEEHKLALRVPKKIKPIITQERCDNIRKSKLGLKQPKVVCPYCKKEGGEAAMTRYHFNNCKLKK
jgi:hypothetical protein